MASPDSPSPQAVRVIVVDDHEWILEIAVQVVRQTLPDAQIVARSNGLEALMAFREGGADFVVTNHNMPLMNGATLTRELHEARPELPIVMISVNPEARKDAEAAGANWFLQKDEIMEQMPRLLLNQLRGRPEPMVEAHGVTGAR